MKSITLSTLLMLAFTFVQANVTPTSQDARALGSGSAEQQPLARQLKQATRSFVVDRAAQLQGGYKRQSPSAGAAICNPDTTAAGPGVKYAVFTNVNAVGNPGVSGVAPATDYTACAQQCDADSPNCTATIFLDGTCYYYMPTAAFTPGADGVYTLEFQGSCAAAKAAYTGLSGSDCCNLYY